MRYDRDNVADTLRELDRNYSGVFPKCSGRLTPSAREFGEALLASYVDTARLELRLVTDNALEVLYTSARKSIEQGQGVASSIATSATKPGYNPLLSEPAPTPPVDAPRVPAPPAPPVTRAPDADMLKYALRREVEFLQGELNNRIDSVRDGARRALDNVRDATAETMLKLTDAIPDNVRALVADALKDMKPAEPVRVIVDRGADVPPVVLGTVHYKTPEILTMLSAGVNVYLHGPAGSGKTTAARKCADALGVPFRFAAKVESEYQLIGYMDARGTLVRTQFREAYEHGGVFLFDELDASSPSAVVALNAALANGICPFPDATVERHADFYCIAAGNTTLTGANRAYQGRTQLDGASVDRFAFIEFPYDEALERSLASDGVWCAYVQAARAAVAARGIVHLVTPRATLDGCKLLARGVAVDTVISAVLWKGLDKATADQLSRTITAKKPVGLELI